MAGAHTDCTQRNAWPPVAIELYEKYSVSLTFDHPFRRGELLLRVVRGHAVSGWLTGGHRPLAHSLSLSFSLSFSRLLLQSFAAPVRRIGLSLLRAVGGVTLALGVIFFSPSSSCSSGRSHSREEVAPSSHERGGWVEGEGGIFTSRARRGTHTYTRAELEREERRGSER